MKITIPCLGDDTKEVFIGSWNAQEGKQVNEGELLFEIESDKATLEIDAPSSGTLSIHKEAGEKALIGEVVGEIISSAL